MAEQAFYVILFLATISIAEAAVRNNTFGNDFTSNAIPGSSSLDDLAGDRKAAADLQAKIEAIHQHDPRSCESAKIRIYCIVTIRHDGATEIINFLYDRFIDLFLDDKPF